MEPSRHLFRQRSYEKLWVGWFLLGLGTYYLYQKDKDLVRRVKKVANQYLKDKENVCVEEEKNYVRYFYEKEGLQFDMNCERCSSHEIARQIIEEYLQEAKCVYQMEKRGKHKLYYHIKILGDSNKVIEAIIDKNDYFYVIGSETFKQRIQLIIKECGF